MEGAAGRARVPQQFQQDLKPRSFSRSDEDLVQCCKFPLRDYQGVDNSTIIVFEKVPVPVQEITRTNCDSEAEENLVDMALKQKHKEKLTEDSKSHCSLEDDQSIMSAMSEQREGASSRQSYKFKSSLVMRYSEELEQENRRLRALLRMSKAGNSVPDINTFPLRNSCHSRQRECYSTYNASSMSLEECLPSSFQRKANDNAGSEAWLKMRKISQDMENAKDEISRQSQFVNEEDGGDILSTCTNHDTSIDLISFSSEFSFSSGYRSSLHDDSVDSEFDNSDKNAEAIKGSRDLVTEILTDILESVHLKGCEDANKQTECDESRIESKQKCDKKVSDVKHRKLGVTSENALQKPDGPESGDSVFSESPAFLPDLESVESEPIEAPQRLTVQHQRRCRVTFIDPGGCIIAESFKISNIDSRVPIVKVAAVDVEGVFENIHRAERKCASEWISFGGKEMRKGYFSKSYRRKIKIDKNNPFLLLTPQLPRKVPGKRQGNQSIHSTTSRIAKFQIGITVFYLLTTKEIFWLVQMHSQM